MTDEPEWGKALRESNERWAGKPKETEVYEGGPMIEARPVEVRGGRIGRLLRCDPRRLIWKRRR
jgi:hypothetical protein